MATPITFTVAASPRQGTFLSPVQAQAGFTLLQWGLDIPKTAEYEDPTNSVTSSVLVTPPGGPQFVFGTSTWQGGRYVDKQGRLDPVPIVQFGLDPAQIPDGSAIQVQVVVPVRFTIGITQGVLS